MKQTPQQKQKCPRCAYCGKVVRSKAFSGYENDALCADCLKDPSVTGEDK